MAQAAVEATGGDLFSITVTEPYDPEYNSMAGAAQEDQRNGKEFTFVCERENNDQGSEAEKGRTDTNTAATSGSPFDEINFVNDPYHK